MEWGGIFRTLIISSFDLSQSTPQTNHILTPLFFFHKNFSYMNLKFDVLIQNSHCSKNFLETLDTNCFQMPRFQQGDKI